MFYYVRVLGNSTCFFFVAIQEFRKVSDYKYNQQMQRIIQKNIIDMNHLVRNILRKQMQHVIKVNQHAYREQMQRALLKQMQHISRK